MSPAFSIFLLSKSFVNITFFEAENDKLLRQDDASFKSLFTNWFAQGPEKYFIKLCNSFSLTKFQVISKFTSPSPLGPHTFYIKINTSKHLTQNIAVNYNHKTLHLNIPGYTEFWLCLNMTEYARLFQNMHA